MGGRAAGGKGWLWRCGHGMDCTAEIMKQYLGPHSCVVISAWACDLCDGTAGWSWTCADLLPPLLPSVLPWRGIWAHFSVSVPSSQCVVFLGSFLTLRPVTCHDPWQSSWKSTWKAQVFECLSRARTRQTSFLRILACVTSVPCSANKVFISSSPCPGPSYYWGKEVRMEAGESNWCPRGAGCSS